MITISLHNDVKVQVNIMTGKYLELIYHCNITFEINLKIYFTHWIKLKVIITIILMTYYLLK